MKAKDLRIGQMFSLPGDKTIHMRADIPDDIALPPETGRVSCVTFTHAGAIPSQIREEYEVTIVEEPDMSGLPVVTIKKEDIEEYKSDT